MDAVDWNQRYEGAELLWTAEPNRFLVEEVASLAPGIALDIGCGEGRNSVWLAKQGWSVTGVDFSNVALDKARRLAEVEGASVEWILADARAYRTEPDVHDLAVVLYLHLPAPERRAVLGAAVHSLRPGGTVLVVGHDLTNLSDGYGGPQDPAILFTPDDVVEDLPILSILKAARVTRTVSTDAGERTAIDALVRAVRTTASR
jgi:SAM-dependent methyltransferase